MPSLKEPTLTAKVVCFYFCWKLCFLPIHFAKHCEDCEASAFCFSENSEYQFPLLSAFSFRFIISDENDILNLICLEEFPPKMNPPIVQNIATAIFPLYPSSSSSSEVAPGN